MERLPPIATASRTAARTSSSNWRHSHRRSRILFGLRHTPAGGNNSSPGGFASTTLRPGLTAQEIAASFRGFSAYINDADLLAGMAPQQQATYRGLQAELTAMDARIQKLSAASSETGAAADWRDLGQSLFNLKEFIYVR